jgi:S-formylglutathione hydrolase FrmB
VGDVDTTFRTIARARSRAIGGLSMGAHGALQLALNYPGEFTAVGAHSLVLRRFGSAPSYFGTAADFAKRDPVQIVKSVGVAGCSFALWIDIGRADPWAANAEQFDAELSDLGIKHQWHVWAGDHSDAYWSAHLDDYLRFYDESLSSFVPKSTAF